MHVRMVATLLYSQLMDNTSSLLTFDAHLRKKLLAHVGKLGFVTDEKGCLAPRSDGKNALRTLHSFKRSAILEGEKEFVQSEWPQLKRYFADGTDVEPDRIQPRLELIEANTWQSRLFRLASLTWSVPVSQGYGRRMRFLVWDDNNKKLLGLIALGDPVFNLRVRDEEIGWNSKDREKRLVNVFDAYVLGSVPPYSLLLGGKVVASLLKTKEMRNAFKARYSRAKGIISERRKHPALVLITTTSALGRSSVYNRVTLQGGRILQSVGYTSGWGHFHIPDDLFSLIRKFLMARDDKYADNHQYGDGPNWRMRAVRKALTLLGLNPNLLRHGVNREVFHCYVASNAKAILRGTAKKPRYDRLLSVKEVGQLAVEKWVKPRAARRPEYRLWRATALRRRLNPVTHRSKRTNVAREREKEYGAR
jgi:hypothetical protein